MLGGVPPELKKPLTDIFRYVLPNGRFGPVSHQTKSENFSAGYVTSTTHTTANTEVSVVHGLGRTPYLMLPVVPLDVIGAASVRVQVTRAADASRFYYRSPDTNAVIYFYVE